VNGIRSVFQKGFLESLERLSPDVLALQETKAHREQLPKELLEVPGYEVVFNSARKKGYSGTAIYTRKPPLHVRVGIGCPEHDGEGRVLTAEYPGFYLVGVYFPNAQDKLARLDYKIAFNDAVLEYAEGLRKNKAVVVCGDYNVAHKPIDLTHPAANAGNPGYSPQEREWMDKFLGAGYVDTFRMFEPGGGHYTWWSYRARAREKNVGWRIDYFCVGEESRGRVSRAWIEKDIMGSDHCPVVLEFVAEE
jgi:exodeoxyribonuclease-3